MPVGGADEHIDVGDVIRRLQQEHHDRRAVADIERVIQICRHDLAGAPPAALPELVERLARQRLKSS